MNLLTLAISYNVIRPAKKDIAEEYRTLAFFQHIPKKIYKYIPKNWRYSELINYTYFTPQLIDIISAHIPGGGMGVLPLRSWI